MRSQRPFSDLIFKFFLYNLKIVYCQLKTCMIFINCCWKVLKVSFPTKKSIVWTLNRDVHKFSIIFIFVAAIQKNNIRELYRKEEKQICRYSSHLPSLRSIFFGVLPSVAPPWPVPGPITPWKYTLALFTTSFQGNEILFIAVEVNQIKWFLNILLCYTKYSEP